MNLSQLRTLIVILLIQAISMISWAAIQEKPMKQTMKFILNDVLNSASEDTIKLENDPIMMKNYQLFVYVGSNCQRCQAFNSELQKLASEKSKHINIVLVYDYSSRNSIDSKNIFASNSTYEYFDQKGYMYYHLFSKPQYLSYVLTGPKHTIISEGRLNQLSDLENLKPLITSNF